LCGYNNLSPHSFLLKIQILQTKEENQMKKILLSLVLMIIAQLSASDCHLTNEQKIQNTIAKVAGQTIRHQNGKIKECLEAYSGLELEACEEGYIEVDVMLFSSRIER
jgi:hypothetical protein